MLILSDTTTPFWLLEESKYLNCFHAEIIFLQHLEMQAKIQQIVLNLKDLDIQGTF